MNTENRDNDIKSIIRLEDRIAQCRRCPELIRCRSRHNLGKGDFEPEVLLVFESQSKQTCDTKWVIGLRDNIKQYFHVDRVYHTFLVRCPPKSCVLKNENECCLTNKLVNRDEICLLTNRRCNGIIVKPTNEEIVNCLYFLLEEVSILKPQYIFLFGNRVRDFVLKTYGIFDLDDKQHVYKYEDITFLTTVEENAYKSIYTEKLAELANIT